MKKRQKKSEIRKKNRERQRLFLERKKAKGETQKMVWIAPDEIQFFNFMFSRNKHVFRFFMKYCEKCLESGEKFIPRDFENE